MTRIMLVVAISLCALTGCKKKGPALGEAMAKMETFQKSMCDCTTKQCGDKVDEEMMKWSAEVAKSAGKGEGEKGDPELVRKMTEITTKYGECHTKLALADRKENGSGSAAGSGSSTPPTGSGSSTPPAGSGSSAPAGSGSSAPVGSAAPSGSGSAGDKAAAGSAKSPK
jgi:hypothetical protein